VWDTGKLMTAIPSRVRWRRGNKLVVEERIPVRLLATGSGRVVIRQGRQIDEIIRRHITTRDLEDLDESFLVGHPLAAHVTAYGSLRFSKPFADLGVAKLFADDPVAEFHSPQIP
jgi:hypothetical protein